MKSNVHAAFLPGCLEDNEAWPAAGLGESHVGVDRPSSTWSGFLSGWAALWAKGL